MENMALSVFFKGTMTCYRIGFGRQTKVSQPFDYYIALRLQNAKLQKIIRISNW